VGASTSKVQSGGIQLSNSFEQLAKEDKVVEQVQSRTRITFMDGIMMVGEGSMVVRGFSLTHELL
jgi:hypothetical protein